MTQEDWPTVHLADFLYFANLNIRITVGQLASSTPYSPTHEVLVSMLRMRDPGTCICIFDHMLDMVGRINS